MPNSNEPQPAWIRPTMWASAGIIVVGLIGFFALAGIHAPRSLGYALLGLALVGFALLGISGHANIRTGGRRAGARPDGKPSAVNKWIPYVVCGGFILTGAGLLVLAVTGASGQGVLTGLFIIALGAVGSFLLRKLTDDTRR